MLAQLIILVLVVLAFFGWLFKVLFWERITDKYLFDDITKARIFVQAGHRYKGHNGILKAQTAGSPKAITEQPNTTKKEVKDGKIYQYLINHEKTPHYVTVPDNYPVEFLKGRRIIGVDEQLHLIPSPLGSSKWRYTESQDDKPHLIQNLVQSNIGAEMLKAMTAKAQGSMIMFLIVAVVGGGVIGFWASKNFNTKSNITPPVTTQSSTTTTQQPTITLTPVTIKNPVVTTQGTVS